LHVSISEKSYERQSEYDTRTSSDDRRYGPLCSPGTHLERYSSQEAPLQCPCRGRPPPWVSSPVCTADSQPRYDTATGAASHRRPPRVFSPRREGAVCVAGGLGRRRIAHLNLWCARVIADEGREYRVSYALLQQVEQRTGAAVTRSAAELDAIAHRARELLIQHQLSLWSFHSDNGHTRAGSCPWDPGDFAVV
jgi:hypothetical protein